MEEEKNNEISLKEIVLRIIGILKYFLSKWKLLLLMGILGAGLGFLYGSIQKPFYTATLTFALDDEKGGGGLSGALSLASQFGFDMGNNAGGAFSGANLIELMKSRSIVERTLLKPISIKGQVTTLAEYFIDFSKLRDSWTKNPKLMAVHFPPDTTRARFTLQQDSVLGGIHEILLKENYLSVGQKDKKVSIISIDVKSPDELFSKYFVEMLAKEISDYYVDSRSKKGRINLEILQRQTDSVRGELNGAISNVAVSNDQNFNLNPALNVRRVTSTRRQIDVTANTAILTELVKNLELAKVTLRKETPLIQVIDTPILPLKKVKFRKVQGFFVGGFLFFFVTLFVIAFRKWWKYLMA